MDFKKPIKKWTAPEIRKFKKNLEGQRLCMLTAYDAIQAKWCANSSCDLILVGDSLGMVVQGHSSTLEVTMEQMEYHTQMVRRGAPDSFVITDLPFGSYQSSIRDAVKNSIRLVKAGANAVKLEGGHVWVPAIERIIATGIPVLGHLGLTPQSIHQLGGFRVQAKAKSEAAHLFGEAKELEKAGCMGIVLESIPSSLAMKVTQELTIPTIGIGAGRETDGQVLVLHDVLGFDLRFKPKFVKRYLQLETLIEQALNQYCEDVNAGEFPAEGHTYL